VTAKQLDRLLSILDRAVKVAERWADVEYPVRNENETAEIYRVGDRPEPGSKREYAELPIEAPGRFESKLSS
jgi:hypothetical protein